jgi:hypothetical protein
MAYTINTLKTLLEAGEINKIMWTEYFGELGENRIPTCNDCRDRKTGKCSGNSDPVECFLYGSHSQEDKVLLSSTRIL